MLLYKRNAREAADRLRMLWARRGQDRIFAHIEVPSRVLMEFAATHTDGPTDYPDPCERIRFWDAFLAESRDVEDDWLPIAYLSEFDQGIVAGALGAPMRFMMHKDIGWVSSMCAPMLDSMDDADLLRPNPDGEPIKLLDEQCRVFAEAASGRFGIASFIVIDAMNFVAEMRGMTRAFEDVIDHPEAVSRLMDLAFDLNVFLQERVRSSVAGFMDGSFVNMGSWAPGTPVLFSVDFYHMARPDFYYRWGEPHLQRLLGHFGGGLLHLHSNGRHLLKHVAELRHLVCIDLVDEDWNPRAYEELGARQREAGDTPLMVRCRREEFERDLDGGRLPGNVLYHVHNVSSVDQANRLMDKVGRYRR